MKNYKTPIAILAPWPFSMPIIRSGSQRAGKLRADRSTEAADPDGPGEIKFVSKRCSGLPCH